MKIGDMVKYNREYFSEELSVKPDTDIKVVIGGYDRNGRHVCLLLLPSGKIHEMYEYLLEVVS